MCQLTPSGTAPPSNKSVLCMKNKASVFMVFSIMLLLWILLSGFSLEELIAGTVAATIVSFMSYHIFTWDRTYARRFLWLLAYMPYYIYAEMVSHAQVISMIFTGKINPGIVEISNPHKSDYGTAALANSITMTPGTLTLEVAESNIYVHCIRMQKDKQSIIQGFERFLGRIWP
jgi:multicomponent Na+:H+ antiporter subunit E